MRRTEKKRGWQPRSRRNSPPFPPRNGRSWKPPPREMEERLREMSDEEREALALAGLRQRIEGQAEQIAAAALAASQRNEVAEVLPRLEEAATYFAEGEAPGSPYEQLAHFTRAVIALLRQQPLPPLPPAYVERFAALQAQLR